MMYHWIYSCITRLLSSVMIAANAFARAGLILATSLPRSSRFAGAWIMSIGLPGMIVSVALAVEHRAKNETIAILRIR